MGKIVIAGGTGFIGQALCDAFVQNQHSVRVLTRNPSRQSGGIDFIHWDPADFSILPPLLDNIDCLINLVGHTVNCRHNKAGKEAIYSSRIQSVLTLGKAVNACQTPPQMWIQASSIGYYGNSGDRWCYEESPAGNSFLSNVVLDWEAALEEFQLGKTCKLILRIGVVLNESGGFLEPLKKITHYYMGAAAGSGRQYISWIHRTDVIQAILWLFQRKQSGLFNLVAPNPVQNRDLMKALREHYHRPSIPNVPTPFVKLGAWLMKTSPELALSGTRVSAEKLQSTGFQFNHPNISPNLL